MQIGNTFLLEVFGIRLSEEEVSVISTLKARPSELVQSAAFRTRRVTNWARSPL